MTCLWVPPDPVGSPGVSPALPWDRGSSALRDPTALPCPKQGTRCSSFSPGLAVPPIQSCCLKPGKELFVLRPQEETDFMGRLQIDVAGEPLSTKTLEQEQAVLREWLCSHIGLFMTLWELEFLCFLL